MASLEAWRDDYERPAKRPEATPATPAGEGSSAGDRALVGVQHARRGCPLGRYVATDDLSEVSCLQCRRTELWRQALKDPSEVARYRPHCEAYEEAIRADRARFFAERAAAVPVACHACAARGSGLLHMLEGSDTRH